MSRRVDFRIVGYQTNRQVYGCILPPQVFRAFGAHCQKQICRRTRPDLAVDSAIKKTGLLPGALELLDQALVI
jgi:hypothetical protein